MHAQAMATPGIERRGGMTWIGDNSIEIGEPFGETSPVHRFLARFEGGMHSVAVQVEDLDEALRRAESHGVRVADRPVPGVAFTRPGDTEGLLFEWNQNPQPDDPRWGATSSPRQPSVLDPQHFAYVAALVPDPLSTASRLSEVLDTKWADLQGGGHDDAPWAAVGIGDCSLAFFPLPQADRASKIWGIRCDRPRFVAMAVTVGDLESSRSALEHAGFKVSFKLADGSHVLHGQGLPFPIVVNSTLLAGDPRTSN